MALLGMKLRSEDPVPLDSSDELAAVVGGADDHLRVARDQVKAVHEIECRVGRHVQQYGRGAAKLHRVPADVRDLQVHVIRLEPAHLARNPAKSTMVAMLEASLGQELHSEADAEEWFPSHQHRVSQRL